MDYTPKTAVDDKIQSFLIRKDAEYPELKLLDNPHISHHKLRHETLSSIFRSRYKTHHA